MSRWFSTFITEIPKTFFNYRFYMKKHLSKLFALVLTVACLASPLNLMADHYISAKQVAGTYQVSGSSNSFSAAPLGVESQALVGQVTLNHDGTGVINFGNITIVNTIGTVSSVPLAGVQVTWALGLVDGQATVNLINVPVTGVNSEYAISFKKRCKRVTGFSGVTTVNTSSNLVTLIQAERF